MPVKGKGMADRYENEMSGGVPARVRALDGAGNSISPTVEEVENILGIYRHEIFIAAKGVVNIAWMQGLYTFKASINPGTAVATFGDPSRPETPIQEVSNNTSGAIVFNEEGSPFVRVVTKEPYNISIGNNNAEWDITLTIVCISL